MKERILRTRELIEPQLLDIINLSTQNHRLKEAMLHSIKGSGKYIRPYLVLLFANQIETPTISVLHTAAALELVHCYSLIHDDLPAMDNAELRRGLPSCWKEFDEATAILAGDALIPLAYEVLGNLDVDSDVKLRLINDFSKAIGARGLVAGQMMDLYPSDNLNDIRDMQLLKTGALLSFGCKAGVILSKGLTSDLIEKAEKFGQNLGLIYQITDDFLSLNGNQSITGKPCHNDDDKITFLSAMGTQGAQDLLTQLTQEARIIASSFDHEAQLNQLLDFIINRDF